MRERTHESENICAYRSREKAHLLECRSLPIRRLTLLSSLKRLPWKSYRIPGEKKEVKLQVMCEATKVEIRTWVSGSASADLLMIWELMEHVITIEPPLL